MQLVAAHFNELVFCSNLSPQLHVILHAGLVPELQNPLFQLAKENLLTREKVHVKADEGWWNVFFPGPLPPSATVPPLPEARVVFG